MLVPPCAMSGTPARAFAPSVYFFVSHAGFTFASLLNAPGSMMTRPGSSTFDIDHFDPSTHARSPLSKQYFRIAFSA
jgi:hypothetical protein